VEPPGPPRYNKSGAETATRKPKNPDLGMGIFTKTPDGMVVGNPRKAVTVENTPAGIAGKIPQNCDTSRNQTERSLP